MTLLWFYFTFAEYLTVFYGNEPVQTAIFWSKLTGRFSPYFWGMFLFCFVIPLPILSFRKSRTVLGTSIASASIVLGMWLERFVIIVPTLTRQRLSVEQAFYITDLGGVVHPGRLRFLLLAPLHPLYQNFSHHLHLGDSRRSRKGRLRSIGKDQRVTCREKN